LKAHLVGIGLKQTDLAKRLGISTRYASDIVLGKRKAPELRRRMVEEIGLPEKLVGIDSISKPKRKSA
jgi:transcriptional regulator with XRE-family HTH domain